MSAIEVVAGGNGVIEVLVPGPQGPGGPEGPGLVRGGLTGQVLAKASGDDYDTYWVTLPQDLELASQAEAIAGTDATVLMTPERCSEHFGARVHDGLDSDSGELALSAAAGRTLALGKVPMGRTLTAGTGLSGGGDLSGDRSFAVVFASQGEATAGASATAVMSPLRVKNVIDARLYNGLDSSSSAMALTAAQGKILADGKVPTSRLISAGSGLSGGGSLVSDRSLAVAFASQAEAEGFSAQGVVMNPLRTAQAIAMGLRSAGQIAQPIQVVNGSEIDCSTGNYFTKAVTGDVAFTVTNVPLARSYGMTLKIEHGAGTVTWFAGVLWSQDSEPVLTPGKVHLLQFHTDNGGLTWRANAQLNYAA